MKRKLSLKTRLMMTISLLLVVVSIVFTFFSIVNAYVNMVRPFEKMIMENISDQNIENVLNANHNLVVQVDDFFIVSIVFMVIAIIIGCSLTYLVAKFSLKPLKIWSEEISTIDQNQLSHRIHNSHTKDELDSLADSFNALLDRLQKAFEREKRFSAAAAHELKTPLTVVKANIEFLQINENPTMEDYEEAIDVIGKQNERMIHLVNDLMLMSTSNGMENDGFVDIDMIIDEIVNELQDDMQNKHIQCKYNKIGFCMKGNPILIKHSLSNLIQNAIKYNVYDGKIMVNQVISESQYTITISDTGIGIKEADIPYIFEPFYRADKSRSRIEGGAGLGLAITKEIIVSHHGCIEYKALVPKGSQFIVSIPLVCAER